MASIRREFTVSADPEQVWDAVRDVGAIHARLARGFVTDTVLDGDTRTVTFVNGFTVQERIVTVDDAARRLVYSASGGRTTHHNASFEVHGDGSGRTRVVWTTDLLPDSAQAAVEAMVDLGVAAMRRTLESAAPV